MAEATPLFQPACLVADAPLLQKKTIFVGFGYYFGLLCLLLCIAGLFVLKKVKQREMWCNPAMDDYIEFYGGI